ncbi:MAG: adenine phosphoribosyltransferase [Gemmatimonadota bacterium]
MSDLASLIQPVPDFPEPGILFRDITPLLLEPGGLGGVVDRIAREFAGRGIDTVAAIESRGFIFGAPLAVALGCGFVPVRKLGKLPRPTRSREYRLEYGTNHLEMHEDAVRRGQRVLIVDDVLATGGTARATVEIVEELGGVVVAAVFLLELAALNGRGLLEGREVRALLSY